MKYSSRYCSVFESNTLIIRVSGTSLMSQALLWTLVSHVSDRTLAFDNTFSNIVWWLFSIPFRNKYASEQVTVNVCLEICLLDKAILASG